MVMSLPWVKQTEGVADQTPPSSAELRMSWRYVFASLLCLY